MTPEQCLAKARELYERALKAGRSSNAAKFRSIARDWEEIAQVLAADDGEVAPPQRHH
jgi:hypothetical protein